MRVRPVEKDPGVTAQIFFESALQPGDDGGRGDCSARKIEQRNHFTAIGGREVKTTMLEGSLVARKAVEALKHEAGSAVAPKATNAPCSKSATAARLSSSTVLRETNEASATRVAAPVLRPIAACR
jgi:hypothetical protein